MTSLKTPQLNLFHNRRNSLHGTYDRIDKNSYNITKGIIPTRQYESKNKDQKSYHYQQNKYKYQTLNSRPPTHSLYKNIAQNYLNNRPTIPLIYPEPTAYIYPLPPYASLGRIVSPLQKSKRNYPCECQDNLPTKYNRQKGINKNPYIQQTQQHKYNTQNQPKIQRDPYLLPTFRNGNSFEVQKINKNDNLQGKKEKIGHLNQNIIRDQFNNNSGIVQKLKTHHSAQQQQKKFNTKKPSVISHELQTSYLQTNQAQIQTQKYKNNSSIIDLVSQKYVGKKKQPVGPSKSKIQKILEEQRQCLQQLKYEYQKQDEYKTDLDDLLVTKDQYFQKSNQILWKLDKIANSQVPTSSVRKSNLFGSVQI